MGPNPFQINAISKAVSITRSAFALNYLTFQILSTTVTFGNATAPRACEARFRAMLDASNVDMNAVGSFSVPEKLSEIVSSVKRLQFCWLRNLRSEALVVDYLPG